MKAKRIAFFLLLIVLFFSAPTQAQSKMPFSTAIINYKIASDNANGEEVVYIDLAKNKICKKTTIKQTALKPKVENSIEQIVEGKKMMQFDLDKKIAFSFEGQNEDAIANVFNEDGFSANYKGKRLILGKVCNVYVTPEAEFCFWNGVLLRQEIMRYPSGMKFHSIQEAIKISLDVAIPESEFEIPPGIKVVTPEEFAQIINGESAKEEKQNAEVDKSELETIIEEVKKMKEAVNSAP